MEIRPRLSDMAHLHVCLSHSATISCCLTYMNIPVANPNATCVLGLLVCVSGTLSIYKGRNGMARNLQYKLLVIQQLKEVVSCA